MLVAAGLNHGANLCHTNGAAAPHAAIAAWQPLVSYAPSPLTAIMVSVAGIWPGNFGSISASPMLLETLGGLMQQSRATLQNYADASRNIAGWAARAEVSRRTQRQQ